MSLERFENGPHSLFASVAAPITIWDRLGFPDNDSALREAIKNGLSYSILKRVAAEIHIPEAVVSKALNLQSERVVRRRKTQRFNAVESDRIHSLLVVFSAAVRLFENDQQAACDWLQMPCPGLGMRAPIASLCTFIEIQKVSNLIQRLEYGVYT